MEGGQGRALKHTLMGQSVRANGLMIDLRVKGPVTLRMGK